MLETVVTLTGDRDLARRLPLFDVCALLAFLSLTAAIALRRLDVLAIGVPFLVAVTAAVALWRPIDAVVRIGFERSRVIEGDDVTIEVDISSERGLDRIEIELFPSERLAGAGALRAVSRVEPSHTTKLSFTVKATEWGVGRIDRVAVRVADRFAMFGGSVDVRPTQSVSIGLPEDRAAATLEAERFRRIVGSHLSQDRGTGLEIADIRPFQPGDSARNINWRISNRRHEPWVNLRHPDRSSIVIVVVDAHDGMGAEQALTQRRSVAAALALCRGHLALHDSVGLLIVGHTVAWLPPKLGRNQLFAIADQLVSVSNAPEASRRMYRPAAVSNIPSSAIVVAVSPLRDPLMVSLVGEIRSHGNPVSVLVPTEASPRPRRLAGSKVDQWSRRLAAVEQNLGVQSLRNRGVAIVPWTDEPVVTIIESVQRLRQSMARARGH